MSREAPASRLLDRAKADTALSVIEALEDARGRYPHLKDNLLFQSLLRDAIFEFASAWEDNATPNEWRAKQ